MKRSFIPSAIPYPSLGDCNSPGIPKIYLIFNFSDTSETSYPLDTAYLMSIYKPPSSKPHTSLSITLLAGLLCYLKPTVPPLPIIFHSI